MKASLELKGNAVEQKLAEQERPLTPGYEGAPALQDTELMGDIVVNPYLPQVAGPHLEVPP